MKSLKKHKSSRSDAALGRNIHTVVTTPTIYTIVKT